MTIGFRHVNELEFCETPTSQDIFHLLNYCHQARDIGVLIGRPGIGKTKALMQYALNKNVFFCRTAPSMSSLSSVMGLVCQSMGLQTPRRSADIHEVICNYLEHWADNDLLIVDECQRLNNLVIDELRCIHDETGLALVLCGNPEFQSRFNNSRAADFAQFTSRVGMRLELLEPDQGDVDAIAKSNNVAKDAMSYLHRHAKHEGALRRISKLILIARKSVPANAAITLESLKSAAKMLGVEK